MFRTTLLSGILVTGLTVPVYADSSQNKITYKDYNPDSASGSVPFRNSDSQSAGNASPDPLYTQSLSNYYRHLETARRRIQQQLEDYRLLLEQQRQHPLKGSHLPTDLEQRQLEYRQYRELRRKLIDNMMEQHRRAMEKSRMAQQVKPDETAVSTVIPNKR
jgi:hypothetical protein